MATNTGIENGRRPNAAKTKPKSPDPATERSAKRDAATGRFEAARKALAPSKGGARAKIVIQHNPSIPKSSMDAARRAVDAYMKAHRAA